MRLISTSKLGRFQLFLAKIGSHPGTLVAVKRTRDFKVGQKIEYADTDNLKARSTSMAPQWQPGIIWKIDGDRLFINRN